MNIRTLTRLTSSIKQAKSTQHSRSFYILSSTARATPQRISSLVSSSNITQPRFLVQKQHIRMASKITEWVKSGDKSGEFKRQQSSFRDSISREQGAKFPPEKGRYHLYVSYACPWACRTLITRKLKGLEDIISYSVVHWHLGAKGWRFVTKEEQDSVPGDNVVPDPIPGHESFTHLRDVYFESEPNYEGRFTVPVLYDTKLKTIVSNESSEIIRMLYTECVVHYARRKNSFEQESVRLTKTQKFDDLVDEKYRQIKLYPESLRSQIDETNEWTYDKINNGVYKSGFATTQEAYERNVVILFEALDKAEAHLKSTQNEGPYYFGKDITEADIRLFVTIIRFDPVYVQHFKCNIRDIRSGYPYLHKWMRHLYWNVPAFHDTTQFEHIKWHYTKSHTQINPFSISPVGPLPDILPLDEEVRAVSTRL
nr:glutathione s-transferase [Colletotrichum truncatum]KAF6792267.1 glutathione s-transferase [Colletotrichum truncatum]